MASRAVLSRDLSQFLVDLSIALHRQAMYPPGHPSLVPVLQTLIRRAETLLEDRSRFVIGVARDRLVIDGVVTDVRHPLLRGLAERLHGHQLGAVAFARGLSTDEIVGLLGALAEDPDRGAGPLGAAAGDEPPRWPHIRPYPMRLDRLDIVEESGVEDVPPPAGDRTAHRCAQLWVGLAHAAIDGGRGTGSVSATAEPALVARAIDEHERVEAYDQVIVGYLQQIAEELRAAGGADALELRQRTSRLVGAMRPETLQRLLAMGGDALQRRQFLKDAAVGMTAGAVVELVKAAAEASQENVSNGMVRMLSKLAAHAEAGPEASRPLAESALRDQVLRLLGGWDLPDPNPTEYTAILHRMSVTAPPAHAASDGESPLAPDSARLVEMSLELDEESPGLWHALDRLLDEGAAGSLAATVAAARTPGSLADRLWAYLTSPLAVTRMLHAAPPDIDGLDAVLPHLRRDGLAPVFDVLAETDDRALRRTLLDRLRLAAPVAAPMAIERLNDERWYVVRNLLHLLSRLETLPEHFNPLPFLTHADARVRREALRVALRVDLLHTAALGAGLADDDPSVLGLALGEARRRCPRIVVPRLVDLAGRDSLDDALRAQAVRALGAASRDAASLDVLLRVAGRILSRSGSRASHHETVRAAVSELAAGWPDDRRVRDLVRRAGAAGLPVEPAPRTWP